MQNGGTAEEEKEDGEKIKLTRNKRKWLQLFLNFARAETGQSSVSYEKETALSLRQGLKEKTKEGGETLKNTIAILARAPNIGEMKRKAVSGTMLNLLFLGLLAFTFPVQPIDSARAPLYFEIEVKPEYPTIYDEVNGTVVFLNVSAINIGFDFGSLIQVGNEFSVNINVSLPSVLLPVYVGEVAHTYQLGLLPEGSYSLNVTVQYWTQREDGTWVSFPFPYFYSESFMVTASIASSLLIETSKGRYALGEQVNITLTNIGNVFVEIGVRPSCKIVTYPDLEPVWPKRFTTLVWGLAPGESETWTWNQYNEFTNSPAQPGEYRVFFSGMLYPPSEVNEALFWVTIPFPGDVNNDGIVDLIDVVIASKAFASYPGHPRWDPRADMNADNVVDIFDVVLIVANFGKTA